MTLEERIIVLENMIKELQKQVNAWRNDEYLLDYEPFIVSHTDIRKFTEALAAIITEGSVMIKHPPFVANNKEGDIVYHQQVFIKPKKLRVEKINPIIMAAVILKFAATSEVIMRLGSKTFQKELANIFATTLQYAIPNEVDDLMEALKIEFGDRLETTDAKTISFELNNNNAQ